MIKGFRKELIDFNKIAHSAVLKAKHLFKGFIDPTDYM